MLLHEHHQRGELVVVDSRVGESEHTRRGLELDRTAHAKNLVPSTERGRAGQQLEQHEQHEQQQQESRENEPTQTQVHVEQFAE